jgi:hypothetical protein
MSRAQLSAWLRTLALILCRLVLPASAILLLLLWPSFNRREVLVDSPSFDWIARLLLAAYFCIQYWRLPSLFEPRPGRWLSLGATVLHDPI